MSVVETSGIHLDLFSSLVGLLCGIIIGTGLTELKWIRRVKSLLGESEK